VPGEGQGLNPQGQGLKICPRGHLKAKDQGQGQQNCLLFQPQGRSDAVLAALLWQDRPLGTLFKHRYAAVILHPRSVVI